MRALKVYEREICCGTSPVYMRLNPCGRSPAAWLAMAPLGRTHLSSHGLQIAAGLFTLVKYELISDVKLLAVQAQRVAK